MGLWDAITDAADAVGDAVSDAAESVYDTVASSSIGDAIAWGARGIDTATFGVASHVMNAADDYVFDTVDYVTGGAINIDFDDGQFTVGAGIDGLSHMGLSVGEAGIGANGEVWGAGAFDVSMTDAGFAASGHAGIDWGPLPYAEGHVQFDQDGNVSVGGRVQGTIPTPYGMLSGHAAGGFTSTSEGWGTYVDASGTLYMPSGTTIHGAFDGSYVSTAEGSHASFDVEGSVGLVGYGTFGGGVGYERFEHDGDVVEGFHAHADADAYGMSLHAEADYTHSDIDGVEHSDWSGDVDVDGPDLSDVAHLAAQHFGGDALGDTDLGDADLDDGVDFDDLDDAPVDHFDAAIHTADSIDESMNDLVSDLQ
jgi:hypothetical protein